MVFVHQTSYIVHQIMALFKKLLRKSTLFAVRHYLNTVTAVNFKKGGQKAWEIFSKPRQGKPNAIQKAYLAKAHQEVLYFEETATQVYYWAGEKPPILLVHGWESNAARWKPLITELRKAGYAVVALDAPAHGASGGYYFNPVLYANMLNVVVEKYKPTTIVGHSVGGYTAAYYLRFFEHPSVLKAVLMAAVSDNSVLFNTYLHFIKVNPKVHEAFFSYFNETFGAMPTDLKAADFAKQFSEKALIIHDADDELIPLHNGEAIHQSWQGSQFIRTEGLGHRLRDKQVDRWVVDFIES
jgi:pimeloyl-ACP methyl ester carboxylesterase